MQKKCRHILHCANIRAVCTKYNTKHTLHTKHVTKIILISSLKGGVGKDTITLFFAQYLLHIGASVAVVDADTQRSITALSPEGIELIPYDDVQGLDVQAVRSHPAQIVIINTPPYRMAKGKGARFMQVADFVLIPTLPGVFDLLSIKNTLADVRAAEKPYAVLMNRVKASSNMHELISAQLDGVPVLKTMMHDRVAYQRAPLIGGLQAENNRAAFDEVADIVNEVLTKLI